MTIILWPICDILLSPFIFLFFDDFNFFLTVADSYNSKSTVITSESTVLTVGDSYNIQIDR